MSKDATVVQADTAHKLAHDADLSTEPYEAVDPYAHTGQVELTESSILVQKKMHLVNAELDRLGFGRYQLCIFLLCGFGYFLDLMWAQSYGLVLAPLQRELGLSAGELVNLSSVFSAGLTVGAFFWGIAVDVVGRKWAFNLTCLIASIFGISFGAPHNYNALLAMAFFNGLGIGGNIPIDATITLEFLPKKNRYLLAALSVFQPLGVVVASALAYAFIPPYSCEQTLMSCKLVAAGEPCCVPSTNRGWRYLTYTIGAITLFVFFLRFVIFNFQESPKWLLIRGEDKKAYESVAYIARFNRKECLLKLSDFEDIDASSTYTKSDVVLPTGMIPRFRRVFGNAFLTYGLHLKGLFRTRRSMRITLTVWAIYITDFWGFTMAGYLPLILSNIGIKDNSSIQDTYKQYMIIYCFGVPGVLLGTGIIETRLGRKWSMFVSAALMSLSLFLFVVVNTNVGRIGFNAMEYFAQSMFNAILYGWTPEVFPAQFRGSAAGFASTLGRITGFIAPQIAGVILKNDPTGKLVLYLAGGGVALSALAVASLPNGLETRGKEVF